MAATGRRSFQFILLLVSVTLCRADQAHDVLQVINRVTTALTANNPADAIAPFDKSFAGYETLADYFANLTSSYAVSNEADIVDETDSGNETKLTLDWTLTLQNERVGTSEQRREQVQVRLVRKGNRWVIADLSPLNFFAPQR
jgi:hypothetical protein